MEPKIPIDWKKVDSLIECGNNGIQVAANLGIHPDTLYIRCQNDFGITWTAYSAEKRQKGVSRLLAKQYEVAMKGNTTMLIWVGKQMAGQKEKHDDEVLTNLATGLNELLATFAKNNTGKSFAGESTLADGEPLLDKELPGAESQVLS